MRTSRAIARHCSSLAIVLCAVSLCTSCTPRDPLEAVRELQAHGRFEASIGPLRPLLEERPDDPEVQYLYGVACVRSGHGGWGVYALRKARERAGWELRAGLELARAGLSSQDFATAIEAANRVLELEPDLIEALALRAEAHAGNHDFEAALADADRVLAIDSDQEDVAVLRVRSLIGLMRLEEAEGAFAELETRREEGELARGERYCAAHAVFAKERGEAKLAEERYEGCIADFPASPLVIEEALEFFDAQRNFGRGDEILRAALEQDPAGVTFRQELARRLRAAGKAKEAEQLLLEGTRLEPAPVAAQSWIALAHHYFDLEDFSGSASAWEELLKLVPGPGPQVLFSYAESLGLAGRYERALEVAEGLPEVYRELIRGRVSLEEGQPRAALASFEAGIRLWPDNAVARYYAARAAEGLGDFDRAVSEYRDSIRADPAATDAGLRLAQLYAAEGNDDYALMALGHYLPTQPKDPEGYLLQHRIAARLGQDAPMHSSLERLSGIRGQTARALAEAATSQAASLGPRKAADFLLEQGRALGLDFANPEHAEALRSLVLYLAAAGVPGAALVRADAAVEAHPDAAALHAIRGLALERAGASREEIRSAYSRALELDPRHAPAIVALAGLEAQEGRFEAAVALYDRAAAADPNAADARRAATDLVAAAGKTAEAERRLEKLLADCPYDGLAAASLAALQQASGKNDRALASARRAVRFRGGPEGYLVLARVLTERGELERAVAALREGVVREPDSGSLRYALGRAFEARGDREGARGALRAALEIDEFPERSEAQAALARVEGSGG